jgi:hypothetical protein
MKLPISKFSVCSLIGMMLFVIASVKGQDTPGGGGGAGGGGGSSTALTCKDGLNVSVDTLCDVKFDQSMFLQGTTPTGLEIFITDGAAIGILPTTNLVGTTVSFNNIMKGMSRFTYELRNPADGNKCWGFVTFEDKIAPRVTAKMDTIVCTRFANVLDSLNKGFGPITGVSAPVVSDSCQIAAQPVMSITTGGADCNGKTITRTWIGATDKFGNLSVPTSATIFFAPLLIDSVKAPDSVVTINACTLTDAQLTPEAIAALNLAVLTPAGVRDSRGFPTVGGVRVTQACNLIATYDDVFKSNLCGGGRKIIREWTVLDWCKTGLVTKKFSQIIKVEDKVAPVFGNSTLINNNFDADPWTCGISVRITGNATDNCGNVTYTYISNTPNIVITDGNLLTASLSNGLPSNNFANGRTFPGIARPAGPNPNNIGNGITVIATDACGNTTTRLGTINIFDKAAPVIILKEKLVMNLTSNSNIQGQARGKVYATNIDNGTYDLCGLAKVEVRRRGAVPAGCDETVLDNPNTAANERVFGNSDWRPFVTFCCEDANTRQVVEFLATDNFGNTSLSWAEVLVEAKSSAQITCVPVTVECNVDIAMSTTAVALPASGSGRLGFNRVSGDVLCTNEVVTYQDAPALDGCNVGRVVRTFRLSAGSSQNSCTSVITVNRAPNTAITLLYRPNTTFPSGITVTSPATSNINTTTITTCNLTQAIIDSRKPSVQTTQGSCDIFGENIDVKLFNIEAGVCKKWAVTYNFINWCNGAQKSHTEYFSYVDNTNPVVTAPNLMFEAGNNASGGSGADASGCTGIASLSATATDANSCDAVGWIKWIVEIDLNSDNVIDYTYRSDIKPTISGEKVLIPNFNVEASMNTHTVKWTANDGCGNSGTTQSTFMVVDKKAPTPYCISLSTALMVNCQVELWAKDFDKGSFDNCTPTSDLLFTFDGANPVLTKLNDIHYFNGKGVESTEAEYLKGNAQKWLPGQKSSGFIFTVPNTYDVKMNVWDAKLNTEFCNVQLKVIDNTGKCGKPSACDCEPNQFTGMAVITCNAEARTNGAVGAILDVRKNLNATRGADWAPSINKISPRNWTIDSIGQVFGVAVDDATSNVYLAASDIYDTQFNSDPFGPGQIFIARPPLFRAVPFANLPNTGGSLNGIGGIVFDKKNNQVIVSNLEDGKIHRLNAAGTVVESYDPWSADNNSSGIVATSEQVWGLGINNEDGNCKIYFARISNTERTIQSITLGLGGKFPTGAPKVEISNLPGVGRRVSDIEFSGDGNSLLLAERGSKFVTGAHDSRVMKYTRTATTWAAPLKYQIGAQVGVVYPEIKVEDGEASAGGVDFGYAERNGIVNGKCDAIVWASANWMRTPNGNLYYGLEGINAEGNNPYNDPFAPNMSTDIIIDYDGNYTNFSQKGSLGDVEIIGCKTVGSTLVELSGKITDTNDKMIGKVNVEIMSSLPAYPKQEAVNGDYKMNVESNNTYTVQPNKSDDYLNGVSTIDLVYMQRHILGLSKFNTPEKFIAADVNRDNKISASDLVELRKLILGVTEKLNNNTSWTFVPKAHVYSDVLNPYNAPRSVTLSMISDNKNIDFKGIKIGDLNIDATASLVNSKSSLRNSNSLNFNIDDKNVRASEDLEIKVTSENFRNIFGYQMTLGGRLEITNIQSGTLNLDNNVAIVDGKAAISWNNETPINTSSSDVLFTIQAKSLVAGKLSEILIISPVITNAEAYRNESLEIESIKLKFQNHANSVDDQYSLSQNEPNPFKDETVIKYQLPTSQRVKFTVVDVTGKVILVKEIESTKGSNSIKLTKNDVKAKGMAYYTLEGENFKATKHMVIIE